MAASLKIKEDMTKDGYADRAKKKDKLLFICLGKITLSRMKFNASRAHKRNGTSSSSWNICYVARERTRKEVALNNVRFV